MSKNKFQGHAPRPTKGELVAAAKQQTKTEEKVGELSGPVLALVKSLATEKPTGQEESTDSAAPAAPEATPAPAAQAKKKEDTGLFALGKRYAPKTDRNSATWGKITKALSERPHTMKELTELVKDHKDFLGYMTRGGHIIPHVAEKS